MNWKKAKLALCLTLTGVLVLLYTAWVVEHEPVLLQYAVTADQEQAGGGDAPATHLKARIDALDEVTEGLGDTVQTYTLAGTAMGVSLGADEGGTLADLVAAGEHYFTVFPTLVRTGRLLHPEELREGGRVALLNEQAAIDLFKMVDVIDREVSLHGQTYRVVGVVRRTRQVGDASRAFIYVPIAELARAPGQPLQTLTLSALRLPKGGAIRTFAEVAQQWKPGGNAYDLRREQIGATIWARFLVCAVGFALLGLFISRFARSVLWLADTVRRRLTNEYMVRMLPFFIGHVLLRVLALAALAGMAAGLTWLLISDPAMAYPEFIPAVLVEPDEVLSTFWALRATESAVLVTRTREMVRLLYFGNLCTIGTIVSLCGLSVLGWQRKRA